MIDGKKATDIVGRLAVLPYFPAATEKDARAEIVLIACKMAGDIDRLRWLVSRACEVWDQWHGPRELRALLCSRFRPADGIEADTALKRFVDDGYPPVTEHGKGLIVGKQEVFMLPGEIATAEQSAVALIDEAMARKAAINRAKPATDEEIQSIQSEQDARRRESQRMA